MIVAVLEHDRAHARLRVVEPEHLREEHRPKFRYRRPQLDAWLIRQAQQFDGTRERLIGDADLGVALVDLRVIGPGRGETGEVPLDVHQQGGDSGAAELLGDDLKALRLPGPRRAGDEAVAVKGPEGQAHVGGLQRFAP